MQIRNCEILYFQPERAKASFARAREVLLREFGQCRCADVFGAIEREEDIELYRIELAVVMLRRTIKSLMRKSHTRKNAAKKAAISDMLIINEATAWVACVMRHYKKVNENQTGAL